MPGESTERGFSPVPRRLDGAVAKKFRPSRRATTGESAPAPAETGAMLPPSRPFGNYPEARPGVEPCRVFFKAPPVDLGWAARESAVCLTPPASWHAREL